MCRPTHHTYYKDIGSNINPMNQPQPGERVGNTHVGKYVEISPQWNPEELGILAEGKKAAEDDLSRHLQTSIAVETAPVMVSGNDRT